MGGGTPPLNRPKLNVRRAGERAGHAPRAGPRRAVALLQRGRQVPLDARRRPRRARLVRRSAPVIETQRRRPRARRRRPPARPRPTRRRGLCMLSHVDNASAAGLSCSRRAIRLLEVGAQKAALASTQWASQDLEALLRGGGEQ